MENEENNFLDGLISPDARRRTREQTQPLVDVLCSPICIRSVILTVGTALLLLTTLLIAISITQPEREIQMQQEPVPAWMLDHVTDEILRSNLEYLSSDLLEGRGTGTRGEDLTTHYVASHFIAAGLSPAAPNGSYYQSVPLASLTPEEVKPLTIGSITLKYPDEFTASSDNITHSLAVINVPMVFVGYGIVAPAYGWDDYKGTDVSDKIVVCLVNEPQGTDTFFAGETLTYYGRWTYKIEQARAKGAKGILLIHTDETAGYGWQVVENSFAGEQVVLATSPKNPLIFRGWVHEGGAQQLAALHGTTLAQWIQMANNSKFSPVPLTTRLSLSATYNVRYFSGTNVVARLGPPLDAGHEAIVIMAHHDHLGNRSAVGYGTDTIYNGAVDNASGVAALIASAYALGLYYSQTVVAPALAPWPPKKTILFVSVTGEESNLLGSSYFAEHSPCRSHICGATSMLNYDIMNVWGRTSDMVAIGSGMSHYMDKLAHQAATEEGLTLTPDPTPHLGHLFRSDQLPFALAGIPSLTLSQGKNYIGKSAGYYDEVMRDYIDNHYHQPSDEYNKEWTMAGIQQQTRMMLRIAYRLATQDSTPTLDNTDILPRVRV